MTILLIIVGVVALVVLIARLKLNPFIAFLIVAPTLGLALGIPPERVVGSVQKGIGDILGALLVVLCAGAMIGKLVAESGAAQKITSAMMHLTGEKNIQWALVITAFIIGIPLFYNVAFVLVIPLLFSVSYQYKLPAVYIGLPMLSALSITHGFLPPHPSPTALVVQLNADMGVTLLYGLIVAVPTVIIAGPVFSKTVKKIQSKPIQAFDLKQIPEEKLPSATVSFVSALFPVLLILIALPASYLLSNSATLKALFSFFTETTVIMLIALLTCTYLLGIRMGKTVAQLMELYAEATKDIVMVLLILAGAGALKQVLVDSGASTEISNAMQTVDLPLLFLGWFIAAVIRVLLGSATIAGLTTAGIIAPLLLITDTDPNLMVISIGAGSLMFSHVNDTGFWMFKEYFNLSIADTIRSWSLMESIVSVCGLLGVLLLDFIVSV